MFKSKNIFSYLFFLSWESYKKNLDNLLNQYKENVDELDIRYNKALEKDNNLKKISTIFSIDFFSTKILSEIREKNFKKNYSPHFF